MEEEDLVLDGGPGELQPTNSKGSGKQGTPATSRVSSSPTSRIAVQKIFQVISNMSPYKRFLVEEMWFGLLLVFPHIPKLNLKFSKWIMSIIDVENHTIVLSPGNPKQSIRFYPADFHKVFGMPSGERNIHGPDGNISPDAVEFIRGCIGLSDKSAHSLKAAESFLQKDLSDCSSRLEKDCFKMSFTIFVMGHFFAPSTKHDYTSVDYWGAIRDTDNIERFNWCQYAFDALIDGIRRLQSEMKVGATVHNLMGCHPFLQVLTCPSKLLFMHRFLKFVNLYVGQFNKTPERRTCRVWMSHPDPRLISIDGQTIFDQFVKDHALDHETCSLAVRRLAQLDEWVHKPTLCDRSRILLEPDFAAALRETRDFMLVELLHIEGNLAPLQLDALELVANASTV
ncbi:hypothetical protein ACQ4PT_009189 [Festuca glaucescens]